MKERSLQDYAPVEANSVSVPGFVRQGTPLPTTGFRESGNRSSVWIEVAGTKCEPEMIRIGSSVIHRRTGKVQSPRGEDYLRLKEIDLLVHLFQHAATTFTRDELLQQVWNYQSHLLTRTVDQTVATLRKKIEINPERPRFLQTVYGIGYRLVLQE